MTRQKQEVPQRSTDEANAAKWLTRHAGASALAWPMLREAVLDHEARRV